jgi:hypothetical protein
VTSDEATVAVIDVLNDLAVPYMLVGSLSSNFYGIPRATQDADFDVHFGKVAITSVAQLLAPSFRLDPQLTFETVTGITRHLLRAVDSPFQIELFLLSEDDHDQEGFRRRYPVRILDRATFVPTAEDVIITKLRWALQGRRAKDLDDARNVIAVHGARLDWQYINQWCDLHGTRPLLEETRRALPPLGGHLDR